MKRYIILFMAAISVLKIQAQEIKPITTGANFLNVPSNATGAALGDMGAAIGYIDESSINYNIARIGKQINDYYFGANYLKLGAGSKNLNADVSLSLRYNKQSVFALNFKYFTPGETIYKDIEGGILGNYKPNEMALTLGYAYNLSDNFSVGIALKGISSNLYGPINTNYSKGFAIAGDIGLYYQSYTNESSNSVGYNFGVSINNLGSKLSYSDNAKVFLPTNLKLGAAVNFLTSERSMITIGAEINKLLVPTNGNQYASNKNVINGLLSSFGDAPGGMGEELKEIRAALGAEFNYREMLFLRAGVSFENINKGSRNFISAGLGYKHYIQDRPLKIDLAYFVPTQSNSPYSNNFCIGIGIGINKQISVDRVNRIDTSKPVNEKKKEEKSGKKDKD